MSEMLKKLATELKIATSFTYSGGAKTSVVSDDLLKFFIKEFGYCADSEEDILASIEKVKNKRMDRVLEAVYVVEVGKVGFDIVLEAGEELKEVYVSLEEKGEWGKKEFEAEKVEERNGKTLYKAKIKWGEEIGYYELRAVTNKNTYDALLTVAPKECVGMDKKGKEKLFGFAIQLYSVKSKRNWGVGDFSDLKELVKLSSEVGADVIGLNPLSVLNYDYPESASPYNSVSRLFLNPIYIDVEKVPYYKNEDKDIRAVNEAKSGDMIKYTLVFRAKMKALENIFERVKKDNSSQYYKDFMSFVEKEGEELEKLAWFEAIRHERAMRGEMVSDEWRKAYDRPSNGEVKEFVKTREDEILFYKFLQFEADRQLGEVEKEVKDLGLAIGLYRDLPVGCSNDSAEVWEDKELFMNESGAGAPPDNNFPTGQKWGLGAFNPYQLKERGYKPFIKILRANMKHAGALRIDHVMGMARLYIIPEKEPMGSYIRFELEDMLNILALESRLNNCMVVGECIGNVEKGFDNLLREKNIYTLGVLWEERTEDRLFWKRPNEYQVKYFSSVATHDMPPLKAWWNTLEVKTLESLNMFSKEEAENAKNRRVVERKNLLSALDKENVWSKDNMRKADYLEAEGFPEGIDEAVNAFVASSNSEVFMLEFENILHQNKLQNLPGTDMENPNWRTKLPEDLEDIRSDKRFIRNIDVVKRYRF